MNARANVRAEARFLHFATFLLSRAERLAISKKSIWILVPKNSGAKAPLF